MSWLPDWFLRYLQRRRSHIEEISHLTDQFYATLSAEVARIEDSHATPAPHTLAEVKELLEAGERSWAHAYRIEQLLVQLYDEPTMQVELGRRLEETKGLFSPGLAAWYTEQAKTFAKPADRRALLGRLVNDLQWRYMVNEVKRGYSKKITRSSGWILVGSLVAFLVWAVWPFAMEWSGDRARGAAPAAAAVQPAEGAEGQGDAAGSDDGDRERPVRLAAAAMHGKTWYLLVLAGLAGAWGASFSLLIGLKERLDESSVNDLKLMGHRATLYSRPLIGAGAAFILYFFVVAGLLAGNLFPDFSSEGGEGATLQNLALLVVLSFIAGFSEKLVPGLLARTEGQIGEPRPEAEEAMQGAGGARGKVGDGPKSEPEERRENGEPEGDREEAGGKPEPEPPGRPPV